MNKWLTDLDRLLRGETTRPDALRDGRLDVSASGMAIIIVVLAMIYGLCMGSYSLMKEVPDTLNDPSPWYMQMVATTVKVPALFYLTLLVTFPSLYVFNALAGSRLTMPSVLRLLIASLAVNLAVLSSLGPIVLFFSVSTKSYAFIKLLNVAAFGVAGVLGLSFLLQTLHRLTSLDPFSGTSKPVDTTSSPSAELLPESASPDGGQPAASEQPSALDMPTGQVLGEHTRMVFGWWVILFALVGAQMGWVLRPFIGSPAEPFAWFRPRGSNFFEAVLQAIGALLPGKG